MTDRPDEGSLSSAFKLLWSDVIWKPLIAPRMYAIDNKVVINTFTG